MKVRCPRCSSDDIHQSFASAIEFICKNCDNHFTYCEKKEELSKSTADTSMTEDRIEIIFRNLKAFLIEKNRRYGDAALNPRRIFSKSDVDSQICNRLDDKVSRIETSKELKKNDVVDTTGYLILLMISKEWLEFDDLLD